MSGNTSGAGKKFLAKNTRSKDESLSASVATGFLRSARNSTKSTTAPAASSPSRPAKKTPKSTRPAPVALPASLNPPPPWKHQVQTRKLLDQQPRVLDLSDPGCVSAETEFLTPIGWKRIDQYKQGDQVAQFLPDSCEIEFVEPTEYVKRPCSTMIAISPARGTSQRLSHEHRVLYYRPDGSYGVCSAAQFMDDLHTKGAAHLHRKFATTFRVRKTTELDIKDSDLRVMVAVIADGHFPYPGAKCVIRIKKRRKIERLRMLLIAAGILFNERHCGGADPDFVVFRFRPEWELKTFDARFWDASQRQLDIVADELQYWDGSVDARGSGGIRFSTTDEASANFAQYCFSAHGFSAALRWNARTESRKEPVEYNVQASNTGGRVGPGRPASVYEIANPEGYKYCFEVPSSFLLLRHNGYIFATGNTGKTRSALEAFADRRRQGSLKALVVSPKSLMEPAWGEDIRKFTPDMTYICAYAENREAAFNVDVDIYIVNTDAVKWLAKKPNSFFKRFDTLIIDELTAYKHRTSARSKAIAKIRKHFAYREGLTGTPNPNSVTELWHQAFIIDDGKRLGTSFFHFRAQCCTAEQIGPRAEHIRWVDKPGAEEAVAHLLRDITIRHDFDTVMDIPPNYTRSVRFTMPARLQAQYDELADQAVLQLETENISAVNAAVLQNKLLQLASGAVYSRENHYQVLDTTRYELISDLVEERKHSIVFFNWSHQKDQLVESFTKRGIEHAVIDGTVPVRKRAEIVERYQAGLLQTVLLHPQTGAHGLTLTRGTACIWSSPVYQADFLKQGIHRIVRGGQTQKTETLLVEAKGTLEASVYERLSEKTRKMVTLLDILRGSKK